MNNTEQITLPRTLSELDVMIRSTSQDILYVAGATDLLVNGRRNLKSNVLPVDLAGINELAGTIKSYGSGLLIGSAVPLTCIIRHPEVSKNFPLLTDACRQIGSVQVQNRATLGGNIANASPAGDTLPVLCVYGAELLIGPVLNESYQRIHIDQMMTAPGQTVLADNRYIAYIYLPLPKRSGIFEYFRKVGPRHAMAISKVSLAMRCEMENKNISDIRIATGSVTPVIKRAVKTEQFLKGKTLNNAHIQKAAELIRQEIDPIDDIRSTRAYRSQICANLLMEALTRASDS